MIHGSISNDIAIQFHAHGDRQLRSDPGSRRSLLGRADRTFQAEFPHRPVHGAAPRAARRAPARRIEYDRWPFSVLSHYAAGRSAATSVTDSPVHPCYPGGAPRSAGVAAAGGNSGQSMARSIFVRKCSQPMIGAYSAKPVSTLAGYAPGKLKWRLLLPGASEPRLAELNPLGL